MFMSLRTKAAVLVLASLAAAACTGDYSTDQAPSTTRPTSVPSSPSTSEPPQATPEDPNPQELTVEVGGTLAITVDNMVVIASPDGSQIDHIDGAPGLAASQPVWSRDGSDLAWSLEDNLSGSGSASPSFSSVGFRAENGTISYVPVEGPVPFYLQWNSTGERLAYLRPEPESDMVEVGLVMPEEQLVPIGFGNPAYFSWSPESDDFVTFESETNFAYFSEDVGSVFIADGVGPYTLPAWSGPKTVIVSDSDSVDELDLETGERTELAPTAGRVRFVLSPNGERLAYSFSGELPPADSDSLPADQLMVLDIVSGKTELVADGPALAWEWSPDSETLAWLSSAAGAEVDLISYPKAEEITNVRQRSEFLWSFWTDGKIEQGKPYVPSDTAVGSYLPFFEQYAQSHKRWSPGSAAISFSGIIDGFDGIWIQAMGHADEPFFVTAGDAVTWGPSEPQAAGSLL